MSESLRRLWEVIFTRISHEKLLKRAKTPNCAAIDDKTMKLTSVHNIYRVLSCTAILLQTLIKKKSFLFFSFTVLFPGIQVSFRSQLIKQSKNSKVYGIFIIFPFDKNYWTFTYFQTLKLPFNVTLHQFSSVHFLVKSVCCAEWDLNAENILSMNVRLCTVSTVTLYL